MTSEALPPGYHTITPMIVTAGADDLISFLQRAFGAEQRLMMRMPDGTVAHCELGLGDSVIMVAESSPEYPGMPCGLHLYVADVDATHAAALAAGATEREAPSDKFYGDRSGTIVDPHGNTWSIATQVEEVSVEEMMARMAALSSG